MKSRLFSRFDPEEKDNKSLQRDLSVFLSLTDSQKASFVGALAEVRHLLHRLTFECLSVNAPVGPDPCLFIRSSWRKDDASTEAPASDTAIFPDKLERELRAFEQQRTELLRKYPGKFVAIHRGRVFAVDEDDAHLAARIERVASWEGAIPICKVRESPAASFRTDEYPWASLELPLQ